MLSLVVFLIRREYFDALVTGKKRAELRVGKMWKKIAEKIMRGELRPIAIFKCGPRTVVREIRRVEIYEDARQALRGKRWKALGIDADSLEEALREVRRMYPSLPLRPAVIFWLGPPRDTVDQELIMRELRRARA